MKSKEIVGTAPTGRPTSKDDVVYNSSRSQNKVPHSTWRSANEHFAAFWLVARHGVRPTLAGTVAELAGLGGVR
jgi:hypothetical protein